MVSRKLEFTSQICQRSKSIVFNRLLKVSRDGNVMMLDGRLFQMRAAATPKAPLLTVTRCVGGMSGTRRHCCLFVGV